MPAPHPALADTAGASAQSPTTRQPPFARYSLRVRLLPLTFLLLSGTAAAGTVCLAPAGPDAGDVPSAEETYPDHRVQAEPGDVCLPSDDNITSAAKAVLGAGAGSEETVKPTPWDHKTPPQYLDRIDARFHLTAPEKATLNREGFVVPSRLNFGSYGVGFHEVYLSQLPVYVSVDPILHAIYASNDHLIAALEARSLEPMLERALRLMHCALAGAGYAKETAQDLDLYLTVARSLLAGAPVPSALGSDVEAAKLVADIGKAADLHAVTLFGRSRNIDFSAFAPRGHYAAPHPESQEPDLSRYFRAAMWGSRLEFNLASRSCKSSHPGDIADPGETPREAIDALALAELAQRSGALTDVERLDQAWSALAGRREDVSITALLTLKKKAHLDSLTQPDAFTRLRAAIGSDFQRTVRTHYMPEGSTILPAIATLIGPRIVADSGAATQLVNGEVPGRHFLTAIDIAYALGQDRARKYLARDLSTFGALEHQLGVARAAMAAPPGDDLYSRWLAAIRALGDKPSGVTPSFMGTESFADLRLGSTIAAFAQIRHNYVLMAGQTYEEGGCEIPDGWVEPAPTAFAALIDYAERGAAVWKRLDPADATRGQAYFARLAATLRVLKQIALAELAGHPLSAEAKRFLAMVVEIAPGGTGGPPTYSGWYYDLFRDRVGDGLAAADLIADFFTSGYEQKIAYAGATHPRLGLFVVDAGGPPRLMVGPVAQPFIYAGPLAKRLADADVPALKGAESPWSKGYTVAAPAIPPLTVKQAGEAGYWDETTRKGPGVTLLVHSRRALGKVTIELLDHHRVCFAKKTLEVAEKPVRFAFPNKHWSDTPIELSSVAVRVGDFQYVYDLELLEPTIAFELGEK